MRILTVIFGTRLNRYLRAWEESVVENCPKATIEVIEGEVPPRKEGWPGWAPDNHYKLEIWRDALYESNENIVLMDADTLVLRDLTSAFRGKSYDIAFTERPGKLPLNGGVVFVRPNERSREFFDRWCEIDQHLLENRQAFEIAKKRHHGMNQASLVQLLDEEHGADIKRLPCRTWNNCDQTWHEFDETTAVLHVKGHFRELLDAYAPQHQWPKHIWPLKEVFLRYDKDPHEGEAA